MPFKFAMTLPAFRGVDRSLPWMACATRAVSY